MADINVEALLNGDGASSESPEISIEQVISPDGVAGKTRGALLAGDSVIIEGNAIVPAAYNEAVNTINKEERARLSTQEYYDRFMQASEEAMRGTLEHNPEMFPAAAMQHQENQQKILVQSAQPDAKQEAVVQNLAPIDLDDESRKQMVARLKLVDSFAEFLDKQGALDVIASFGGTLIPFNFTKDLSDLLDEKFDWTNATDVEQFVLDFQTGLSPEEKEQIAPELVKTIVDVTEGNTVFAGQIVSALLSPTGGEQLSLDRTIDLLFGAADVLPIASSVVGAATISMLRRFNKIKVARELENFQKASQMNVGAMTDPTVASSVGVDQITAYRNSLPKAADTWEPEVAANLAPEVVKEVERFIGEANNTRLALSDMGELLLEGVLSKTEQQRFVGNTIETLKQRATNKDLFNEVVQLDNIKLVGKNIDGFALQYDVIKEGKRTGRVKQNFEWGVDDNGNFVETVKGVAPGLEFILSPRALNLSNKKTEWLQAVESAMRLDGIEAAAKDKLRLLWKDATKEISGVRNTKLRRKVDEILVQSDEFFDPSTGARGKTFTPDELTARGLTDPKGVTAYYKIRATADQIYLMEDLSAKRLFKLKGFKNSVHINGEHAIVKNYERAGDAKNAFNNRAPDSGNKAFDQDSFAGVEITSDLIDSKYLEGKVLVRANASRPLKHADGSVEYFDWMFVNKDELRGLPKNVLHYKPGYAPKFNEGIEFIVKQATPVVKSGVRDANVQRALKFFASKKDAQEFRQEMIADWLEKNPGKTPEDAEQVFHLVRDRERSALERVQDATQSGGGMYYGARSERDILLGARGIKPERLSPLEALQRNMSHVGNLVAHNEWRLGQETRWLNTARALGIRAESFQGTKLDTRIPHERTLERMRDTINMWNHIPTQDESLFQAMLQNFHDWVLTGARARGFADKEMIKPILWFKHSDLPAAARAVSFNLYLGLLSPVQWMVQMSAATNAIAKNPTQGPAAVLHALILSLTDLLGFEKVADKMYSTIVDRIPVLKNKDLSKEIREAWQQTGLREAASQNADIAAATNYGAASFDALRRLTDKAAYFYYAGERMNRRVSFITNYLAKRKEIGRKLSSDELRDVVDLANRDMFELTKANRAWWQGGPTAGSFRNIIATSMQYKQVFAKTVEQLAFPEKKGGLSLQDKVRVVAGQYAFWGLTTIPGGGYVAGKVAEALEGQVEPETLKDWEGGFGDFFLHYAFGDTMAAERVAPLGQISESINDIVFGKATLMEFIAGPPAGLTDRFSQSLSRLKTLAMKAANKGEVTQGDLLHGLSLIASNASGPRTYLNAMLLVNQHKLLDRYGREIIGPGDLVNREFDFNEKVGLILGFDLPEEAETRVISMANKEFDQAASEIANELIYWASLYVNDVDNPEAAADFEAVKNVILSSIDDESLKFQALQLMESRIREGDSKHTREIKKYFERTLPEELQAGHVAMMEGITANLLSNEGLVFPFNFEDEEE